MDKQYIECIDQQARKQNNYTFQVWKVLIKGTDTEKFVHATKVHHGANGHWCYTKDLKDKL